MGLLIVVLDIRWIIGKNLKQSFWNDHWLNGRKLAAFMQILDYMSQTAQCTIDDFMHNGKWNLPEQFIADFPVAAKEVIAFKFLMTTMMRFSGRELLMEK